MLDSIKKLSGGGSNKGVREQSEELLSLINSAREERGALSTMLSQIQLQSTRLAQGSKSLQQVDEKATKVATRLDEIAARLAQIDKQAAAVETLDQKVKTLGNTVLGAQRDAEKLTAPDGELQQHRKDVQSLSSLALQTRDSLEALKKDQELVEELREQLRQTVAEMQETSARAGAVAGDVEQLRGASGQLAQDFARLRESTRESHEEAATIASTVKDVSQKLGSLSKLQEMSKATEERMASLNVLAEHVGQKVKALEGQKATVERAVVEANRLNELVWHMEVQIGKLNEGSKQAAHTEEIVERIEKIARDVTGQLDTALKAKETFTLDVARLERDRSTLTEFIRGYTEKMTVERKEFDAFDNRVRVLQTSVAEAEKGMEALAARERNVSDLTTGGWHRARHRTADDAGR
jgi:DNA repair exonuclease SbcCD ATPase subunit